MEKLSQDLHAYLWVKMVWTFELIQRLSPNEWMGLAGLLVFFIIIGSRLSGFTQPEWRIWSAPIRDSASSFLFWPSIAAAVFAGLTWFVFFLLCYLLNVIPQGVAALHEEIVAIGWGALVGMGFGALAFYWLVPVLQQPAITPSSPDAKTRVISNYDPEEYFRV